MRALLGGIILAMIFAYMAHAETVTRVECAPAHIPMRHCYDVMGENPVHRPLRCKVS